MLLISLPFEKNLREWTFVVTEPLFLGVPTSGYTYFFGVNLKLIFGLLLFLLLLKYKKNINVSFKDDWPLLLLFIIASINTLGIFSTVSTLGLIRFWLSTLIYFSAKTFFKNWPNLFPTFISALFIFSIFIGLSQFIGQKPLGKFIELTPGFANDSGYTTTDGKTQYRVGGYISHPVYFGSTMSILFPIFIAYAISTNLPLTIPLSLIGIIVILGTNSRSVWFTLALIFFLLFPFIKEKYFILKNKQRNKIILLSFAIVSLIIISTRSLSIVNLFTQNGNASIRLELIWQSLVMIGQNPLGVGFNHFTTNLITQSIPKSLNGFIVPVHNTTLLITSELGILAGSLFIYFVYKSLFFRKINPKQNLITYGALVGALTFLISSQFHPLLNLDPTFDFFMLTLGFINSQCQSSTI